jgi:FlaA1/EpsC-like NDP-sugar epimerase
LTLSFASFINKLTILPRWLIIIVDFWVLAIAAFLGYLLRFNFNWLEISDHYPTIGIFLLATSGTLASLITRSYAGIVRYTGIDDAIKILFTSLLGLSVIGLVNLVYYYNYNQNLTPYSVIAIYFFCSVNGLLFYRLIVKNIYGFYKVELRKKQNVIIFGAGHLGISTKQALDADTRGKYRVIGFLEDDPKKINKIVDGIEIYAARALPKLVKLLNIKDVIISVKELSQERKNQLVDVCLRYQLKVKVVPSVEEWVSGGLNSGQIREIKIEDILGRSSIKLEDQELTNSLKGKRVLITGAAGSIGSEIARQVQKYHPKEIVLIDQAESALYQLELELAGLSHTGSKYFYLADVRDEFRISRILEDHRSEIIFHAAAYKHVPLVESNPSEAVKTNIMGTKTLADLAVKYGIGKFVMISTDKAVNPTNVMGCSKRIAEIYVQSLNSHLELIGNEKTRFITTRFGNVLGSNGSVIPLFRKQIEAGGPLTVTHPEVIRYFMTIPEACRLVLEAGVMGKGGEIFLFDMGKPIRIYDLAKKMALLAGLSPGKDIDIVFTGLRDGEKLYEELLNDTENTIPTHHDKILKAKVAEYPYSDVLKNIEFLSDLIHDLNELKMVAMMKEMVPEFKSNYSRFEVLDRTSH